MKSVGQKRALIGELRSLGFTYNEIVASTGLCKSTVAYHCRRLGEPADERFSRRYDWAEVQRRLDAGATVNDLIREFGFARASYSQAVKRGDLIPRPRRKPLESILVAGRRCNGSNLKVRLIEEGLLEDCCDACGISDWAERPLAMQLHHLNGDNCDNRLQNLQLLCPNCHSQTENWGSRAKLRISSPE